MDPTTLRRRARSAARRLPPSAIDYGPRAKTIGPPNPAHRARSRLRGQLFSRAASSSKPFRASALGQPSVHGSGAGLGLRLDAQHPSGAIARAGSFTPTRWCSDASCREYGAVRAGAARIAVPAWGRIRTRRDGHRSRETRLVGPPPAPPREGEHVPPHPRRLRSSNPSRRSWAFVHRMFPTCGVLPAPLRPPTRAGVL